MRGVLLIAAALALPATAWPAAPRWSASAAAGGGYDDNLNAAVDPADRAGSFYGRATAGAAAGVDFGRTTGLRLGASYTGTAWLAFPDLSSHALGASLGLYFAPVQRISFLVMPRAGWRWVGDSARDAFDLGAGATVKVRPTKVFALRASYRYTSSWATDPVYDRSVHHVAAGPELHPASRTWIGVEYALDVGQTVRYETVTTTTQREDGSGSGSGSGSGKRPETKTDTFGTDQVAYQVPSTSHTVALDVEQGLTDQVYLHATGGYSRVYADPTPFDTWFGHVELGVRLP